LARQGLVEDEGVRSARLRQIGGFFEELLDLGPGPA